jgi:SAM-dependent methyltransferase
MTIKNLFNRPVFPLSGRYEADWLLDNQLGPNALWLIELLIDALPFSCDFFDVIVLIDAYHYFGTDMLYLDYLSRFLRPDGYMGIVVPGLIQPGTDIPEHLTRPQSNRGFFWEDACWSFKTQDWWSEHWSRTGSITDVRVGTLKEGWRHWHDFEKILEAKGKSTFLLDTEALEKDQGRDIGFVRAIPRRTRSAGANLYDPAIGIDVGVDE